MSDFITTALEIVGTVIFTLITVYVKDAVFKNTLKVNVDTHDKQIKDLSDKVGVINDKQIKGLSDLANLEKNVEEVKQTQAKEFQVLASSMKDMSTAINQLSDAVAGLKGYLEAHREKD